MNVIVSSFLLVAAAEMGDKTQLLAFTLASRFRRPWTVMAGILAATLLNHAGGRGARKLGVGSHLAALDGSHPGDDVPRLRRSGC